MSLERARELLDESRRKPWRSSRGMGPTYGDAWAAWNAQNLREDNERALALIVEAMVEAAEAQTSTFSVEAMQRGANALREYGFAPMAGMASAARDHSYVVAVERVLTAVRG